MQSPIPHDLKIYNDKFDFEEHGFCRHQWEISVPQKHCILWSVVLSHLRSADFTVPGKFEERLNRLTQKVFDPESVKLAILNYNPFFNIHKCFFDETLRKVILSFKKLLNESRTSTGPKSVRDDLQMISTLLNSNILIVDVDKPDTPLIIPSNGNRTDVAGITLFCREIWNKEKTKVLTKRFTFSLNKDLCWKLREETLDIILESAEVRALVEKEIQPLPDKKEKSINILNALLRKDFSREICELYESPYTMGKLADAGFQTDPTVLDDAGFQTDPTVLDDDKFSAFYYALQSSDDNLVYLLYKYSANSCYESEKTFRDPNSCIISNFSKLEKILRADCAKSKNFEECGDRAEKARLNYQHLLQFNKFLTQISDGIHRIQERPENSSIDKATKRKDIILHILETFISEEFYCIGQLDVGLAKNYKKHKTYYDNLDFHVALLFFDNIFLLKSILKSPREYFYSELESNFLLAAITNKYFTKKMVKDKIKDLGLELDSINLSIIPLVERFNLRTKIKFFCEILREKVLKEEDIVERIPQKEIAEMLNNFQELKDEFLISRLDHYLKAALETESVELKQKLVIQRALQVIGECINIEKEDSASIRHLLRKFLPKGTLRILKKVRNTLSHLESFQFPLKFKIEQDDSLFKSIRAEIRIIKKTLKEVFDVQKICLLKFLVNRGFELIQNFQQTDTPAILNEDHLMQSMESFREELKQRNSEMQCVLGKKKIDERDLLIPNIQEFWRRLLGFASENENKLARKEISPEVKSRVAAIGLLEKDLGEGRPVDSERFDCLFLQKNDLGNIKEDYKKYLKEELEKNKSSKLSSLLHKIKKSPNPKEILNLILDKKKVSDSELKTLYDNIIFSEEVETTLNSLIEITRNPCGDNLSNLQNRIEHLHQISIDEQYDIRYLWERGKSAKVKRFTAYKIVQRYFRDSSFQASLEMLLFDCVTILKNNEDFKSFWLKTSYLFNGIDVRNVLAHGDPLLEFVGDMLDPKDLPSELVKKMLQLFEDRECIEELCELWQKANLKDKIVRCERWEDYSKLLGEDKRNADTYNGIVAFLQKQPEPKMKKTKN